MPKRILLNSEIAWRNYSSKLWKILIFDNHINIIDALNCLKNTQNIENYWVNLNRWGKITRYIKIETTDKEKFNHGWTLINTGKINRRPACQRTSSAGRERRDNRDFETLEIGIWTLFRISCFEFRISSILPVYSKLTHFFVYRIGHASHNVISSKGGGITSGVTP